ncbi:SDR family oxidoreductase [Algoriphagus sp. CAU 1675]|uniref:SDR family oxidoreductase n=1 Tax=Algoriphagus sp. CAU 1675 TaxID=3032597 RepID=UPI0023DAACE5|nr:SDR family oxidoreductase [Algoriphagus sp. CAU 1675]MDF2158071.1 SDR family oxidoreductase [Algoriphagus sp. CAU 1675]
MPSSVIWITGASSGIGEACALKYSKKGYRVILSSRNEKELQRVKSKCLSPQDIAILPLDLSDADSLPDKVKEAIQIFGKIDIMLHNGGISQRSLIQETELSVDRKLMEVNFFGTVCLTKALLPHFIQNRSGHFAVVTSLVGKFGTPYRSAYSASKHALHGFFDTLRAEQFKDNIVVSMICPGFIKTNVSINALTSDGSPLNQMDDAQEKGMSPEECADQIFKAISHKKEEVYIGGKEIYGVYLKRFFPGIFSKFLRKAKVR